MCVVVLVLPHLTPQHLSEFMRSLVDPILPVWVIISYYWTQPSTPCTPNMSCMVSVVTVADASFRRSSSFLCLWRKQWRPTAFGKHAQRALTKAASPGDQTARCSVKGWWMLPARRLLIFNFSSCVKVGRHWSLVFPSGLWPHKPAPSACTWSFLSMKRPNWVHTRTHMLPTLLARLH